MMNCPILCKRHDCEFNYENKTCSYGGDYLTITHNGCETFEQRDIEAELKNDVDRICGKLMPNYYSIMPEEFKNNIVAKVIECSDFSYSGTWTESDIKIAFEREIASRFGIEV